MCSRKETCDVDLQRRLAGANAIAFEPSETVVHPLTSKRVSLIRLTVVELSEAIAEYNPPKSQFVSLMTIERWLRVFSFLLTARVRVRVSCCCVHNEIRSSYIHNSQTLRH